ncbi:MAG: hypothetical protein ACP5G4_10230 [bacterium]
MKNIVFTAFILIIALGGCADVQPQGYVYYISPIGSDTQISKVDAGTGEVTAIFNTKYREMGIVELNGELIVISENDSAILLFRLNPETGEMALLEDSLILDDIEDGIRKSGEWVVHSKEGRILWRPWADVEPVVVSNSEETASDPAISRQAGLLAYSAKFDEGKWAVIVKQLPDGIVKASFKSDKLVANPSISPDGFWIVFERRFNEDSAEILIGDIQTGRTRIIGAGNKPLWFNK